MEGIACLFIPGLPAAETRRQCASMARKLSDGEALDYSFLYDDGWAIAAAGWPDAEVAGSVQVWENDRWAGMLCGEIFAIDGISEIDTHLSRQLAALFEKDVAAGLRQINGSFALALYEKKQQKFWLATDKVGIRPLYHARQRASFFAGSRLNCVLNRFDNPVLHPDAAYTFMHYSMFPSPQTIYKDIYKLESASLYCHSEQASGTKLYWDITAKPKLGGSEPELATGVYEVVEQAVRRQQNRIPATRKFGAYLSGGTDSSTVCGLLSEMADSPVQGFTMGFAEAGYDEMQYARIAADAYALEHHQSYMQPEDVFALLDNVVAAYDEPFDNSSVFPALKCAQMARDHGATYLFAGDGGDEVFAGNERYGLQEVFRRYGRLPRWLRKGVLETLIPGRLERLPVSLMQKAGSYIRRSRMPEVERIYSYRYVQDAELFAGDYLNHVAADASLRWRQHYFDRLSDAGVLDRHLYLDMKLTITDNDLRKVTRMCDLAGVRVRYPLLDEEVIAYGFRLPESAKLRGAQGLRHIFKQAFSDLLPQEIINKPKHGFGLPISRWFRAHPKMMSFTRDILFSQQHRERGYFNAQFIEKLWQLQLQDQSAYYGTLVYQMLMLELWHLHQQAKPAVVS